MVKSPWWFFDEKASYARAKRNESKREHGADDVLAAAIAQVRSRMNGIDAFNVATFEDGSPFRLTPKIVGMPSLVAGASGKGKSRLLHVLIRGWKKARDHRRLQLVDPKGETYLLEAASLAAEYLQLPEEQRAAFVDRIHVLDVTETAVTPLNLFDRHDGRLETSFLANMRAAATRQASPHDFSDLMEFAIGVLYAVVIELGFPLTYGFVERLFTDQAFRTRVILPRIADTMLRATIENFDTVIPTQTRLAVLRQIAKLLATRAVRVALGLSPAMVRDLAPPKDAAIVLANCAVSQHAPLSVAREQAVQRILDILLEATVRPEKVRELLVIEELPVLLREKSSLGEFILEASRTLRWKGLSLLAVAQDPANALPAEMLRTLLLNCRWIASFECTKDEAAWFYPHRPIATADAKLPEHERRARFFKAAMTLPRQHFLFHFKGEPAMELKTITVPEPSALAPGFTEDMLLDVFRREIASTSMVSIERAEAMLAAWEADVLDRGEIAPTTSAATPTSPAAPRGRSIADLLDYLQKRTPEEQE